MTDKIEARFKGRFELPTELEGQERYFIVKTSNYKEELQDNHDGTHNKLFVEGILEADQIPPEITEYVIKKVR